MSQMYTQTDTHSEYNVNPISRYSTGFSKIQDFLNININISETDIDTIKKWKRFETKMSHSDWHYI